MWSGPLRRRRKRHRKGYSKLSWGIAQKVHPRPNFPNMIGMDKRTETIAFFIQFLLWNAWSSFVSTALKTYLKRTSWIAQIDFVQYVLGIGPPYIMDLFSFFGNGDDPPVAAVGQCVLEHNQTCAHSAHSTLGRLSSGEPNGAFSFSRIGHHATLCCYHRRQLRTLNIHHHDRSTVDFFGDLLVAPVGNLAGPACSIARHYPQCMGPLPMNEQVQCFCAIYGSIHNVNQSLIWGQCIVSLNNACGNLVFL